jgi:AcrR family transcriptional regulator
LASPRTSQRKRAPRGRRDLRRDPQRDPRRDILRATEALLLDRGEQGFSIRRLTERCGYRAPTIYHYFGDRRGLLDALLEQRFRALVDELERVPLSGDELDDLRALARAFVAFGLAHPRHYALFAASRPDGAPAPAASDDARRMLEGPFESLARRGRLAAELDAAVHSLWVFLHGFITLQVTRPDFPWSAKLLETGLDALLGGLVQDRPPRGPR